MNRSVERSFLVHFLVATGHYFSAALLGKVMTFGWPTLEGGIMSWRSQSCGVTLQLKLSKLPETALRAS